MSGRGAALQSRVRTWDGSPEPSSIWPRRPDSRVGRPVPRWSPRPRPSPEHGPANREATRLMILNAKGRTLFACAVLFAAENAVHFGEDATKPPAAGAARRARAGPSAAVRQAALDRRIWLRRDGQSEKSARRLGPLREARRDVDLRRRLPAAVRCRPRMLRGMLEFGAVQQRSSLLHGRTAIRSKPCEGGRFCNRETQPAKGAKQETMARPHGPGLPGQPRPSPAGIM